MTVKTLSTMIVRVIGWLVILEGIRSLLSSLLLGMMRVMFTLVNDSPRPYNTTMTYLPVVTAVLVAFIEFGVGFALIQNSEFFGRIFSKGIEDRP